MNKDNTMKAIEEIEQIVSGKHVAMGNMTEIQKINSNLQIIQGSEGVATCISEQTSQIREWAEIMFSPRKHMKYDQIPVQTGRNKMIDNIYACCSRLRGCIK